MSIDIVCGMVIYFLSGLLLRLDELLNILNLSRQVVYTATQPPQ